ncbi:MAG: TetR/AcrR family transcriptional regulator [Candidatus Auribacter fodinae]|jgi:AcrR family transcriptional regulator|uniref:TetR/AcrR family transcriptional regulator n=1 Tax=Candidatus Auribacter fodinae TaxID=2093366 RepID=A0A3A4R9W8_9BACT|nr:MAG: TetR/AcrR family transcriptional regulator [Candidatus Auribacter fodinae]
MATEYSTRQIQITDEAMKLIAESGIHELTIKNVSKRIGISEPAIYRHFESKTAILIAILDIFESSTRTIIENARSAHSSFDMIERIFMGRCESFANKPELATIIFSEEIFRNENVLIEKTRFLMGLHHSALQEIIQTAQNNNEIRKDVPAEHIAMITLGSLRLCVTKWRISGYKIDLLNTASSMWNSIKRMIG